MYVGMYTFWRYMAGGSLAHWKTEAWRHGEDGCGGWPVWSQHRIFVFRCRPPTPTITTSSKSARVHRADVPNLATGVLLAGTGTVGSLRSARCSAPPATHPVGYVGKGNNGGCGPDPLVAGAVVREDTGGCTPTIRRVGAGDAHGASSTTGLSLVDIEEDRVLTMGLASRKS